MSPLAHPRFPRLTPPLALTSLRMPRAHGPVRRLLSALPMPEILVMGALSLMLVLA